jgi:cell division protein ZapA (FtsZ GTPase activity inhibitor)
VQDDKLSKIAYEIDDIIAELSVKYQVDQLSLTSIMLARIVLANDYLGSGADFRKILANIPERQLTNNEVMH